MWIYLGTYIQDATSVPKERRYLKFISIPRKRSSRRKLIKTRPDLSKNRKVKLYSIAQSWLRSLLHRAECCLRQPGHVTTYLQTLASAHWLVQQLDLPAFSSIFAYTLSLKITGAFSIARQFYTIFYRCMVCNLKREEARLLLLFRKRSMYWSSSVALRS